MEGRHKRSREEGQKQQEGEGEEKRLRSEESIFPFLPFELLIYFLEQSPAEVALVMLFVSMPFHIAATHKDVWANRYRRFYGREIDEVKQKEESFHYTFFKPLLKTSKEARSFLTFFDWWHARRDPITYFNGGLLKILNGIFLGPYKTLEEAQRAERNELQGWSLVKYIVELNLSMEKALEIKEKNQYSLLKDYMVRIHPDAQAEQKYEIATQFIKIKDDVLYEVDSICLTTIRRSLGKSC